MKVNNLTAPKLPRRITGLSELAYNLWWSWHIEARELFKVLDRPLWKTLGHNPVTFLQQITPYKLVAAAQNPTFLSRYDSVMRDFKADMSAAHTWFTTEYPLLAHNPVAYFSLEFAIHSTIPLYAGGLGILAGDYCKEASDLGLPMVGISFMYPQGYFHQQISANGWQEEIYTQLNSKESPISRVLTPECKPLIVEVPLNSKSVYVAVWQINVGRVTLYLLDTDIEQNSPSERQLSARLYGGDREMRLQQEIVLGIGGVCVLRALKIEPIVWHANEGHTAFMMLERIRELVSKGSDFAEAAQKVRSTTVFTTHTPVPAGNDVFAHDLMEKYFHRYWSFLKLDRDTFLNLGTQQADNHVFNMTVLGMRLADYRNGVSQLHGEVCRRMWHSLWPDVKEEDVPISVVTNGVHVPTWLAPQMAGVYKRYLGPDWLANHDNPQIWEGIMEIPDEEIWTVRRLLKDRLITSINDRARKRWSKDGVDPVQALAMGALMSTGTLTLGFCRRFTDYKRSALILHDLGRLKQILGNDLQPVQIIFAGKAHPDDDRGKQLIQEIYNVAKDPDIGGRIAFVENYDIHMARYLVRGVDIWLNTPRPLQEASGTSGQKASLNGVPHLSVLDGWWYEGYNGANGWAIHNNIESHDPLEQDKADAEELYRLLEDKIIPLFYERDIYGVPHGWIQLVKETIRSNAPLFSARRMAKEYTEQLYLAAAQNNSIIQTETCQVPISCSEDYISTPDSKASDSIQESTATPEKTVS